MRTVSGLLYSLPLSHFSGSTGLSGGAAGVDTRALGSAGLSGGAATRARRAAAQRPMWPFLHIFFVLTLFKALSFCGSFIKAHHSTLKRAMSFYGWLASVASGWHQTPWFRRRKIQNHFTVFSGHVIIEVGVLTLTPRCFFTVLY